MKEIAPGLIKQVTIISEDRYQQLGRCKYEGKFSCTLKILKTHTIYDRIKRNELLDEFKNKKCTARPHNSCLQFLGCTVNEDGNIACLMELVLGDTLFSFLSSKNKTDLAVRETRVKIAAELAGGLSFLHSQGIIVRNLNSKSILVDQDDGFTPKISNLFEHEILDAIDECTPSEKEKVYWKAPEDKSKKYSSGSLEGDLYSLGIVLWEIASRELPIKVEALKSDPKEIPNFLILDSVYLQSMTSLLNHNPRKRCTAEEVSSSLGMIVDFNPPIISSEPSSTFETPVSTSKEPSFSISYNYNSDELNSMVERGIILYSRGKTVESAKLFDVPAWNGDVTAQLFLGKTYLYGKGRERNIFLASNWLERASEKGLLEAEYLFSLIHFFQLGGPMGLSKQGAMRHLEKLSNQGHIEASLLTAFSYESGEDTKKDLHKALRIYENVLKIREEPMVFYRLGKLNEKLTSPDFGRAFEWYRRGAIEGNSHCEYELALCYHHGRGVDEDSKMAMEWYATAAAQNHPVCLYIIGHKYLKGQGLGSSDTLLAIKYYTQAALRGHGKAQQVLAHLFEKGLDIPVDFKKAAYWYQKAAESGDPYSQNNLGRFYQNGMGVRLNLKRAANLYEKAAKSGIVQAQVNYARCLEMGLGFKSPNPEQAFYWYQKASQQNSPHAQFKLGHCYQRGIGTTPSADLALSLYRKAANSGYHRAIDKLRQLKIDS